MIDIQFCYVMSEINDRYSVWLSGYVISKINACILLGKRQ